MSQFLDALDDRVIIFDGAMGTMLQAANLPLSDYWELENCSEVLNLSRPDVIRGIHQAYFDAGADIVETNTFGATPLVLGEFGLADRTREINRLAVELAREAALASSTEAQPRFVASSMVSPTCSSSRPVKTSSRPKPRSRRSPRCSNAAECACR